MSEGDVVCIGSGLEEGEGTHHAVDEVVNGGEVEFSLSSAFDGERFF